MRTYQAAKIISLSPSDVSELLINDELKINNGEVQDKSVRINNLLTFVLVTINTLHRF